MAGNGAATAGDVLPDRLLSDGEFREVVNRLLARSLAGGRPMRVLVTSVEDRAIVAEYASETIPANDPSHTRTFFEDEQQAVTCRCDMWRTGATVLRSDADELMTAAAELVARHWGERDPATLLPYLKNAGVPTRFAAATRAAAATGCSVAVLHTDLDHFKKVNDSVGEPGGNAVLRQFAGRLREDFGEFGIVVRTGGEEFSALLYQKDLHEIVVATSLFRRRMADEPLLVIDRPNTCSIGLALFSDPDRLADVRHPDDVLSEARDAEKRAKSGGRNRIALSGALPNVPAPDRVGLRELRLAALLARRREPESGNTGGPILAAIREALFAAFDQGFDANAAVRSVRDELSLQIGVFGGLPLGRPRELLGVLDGLQWATAVAGALLSSTRTTTPMMQPHEELEIVVGAGGKLTIAAGERTVDLECCVAASDAMRASSGRPFYEAGHEPASGVGRSFRPDADIGLDPQSPVLLLPIGDAAKVIAAGLRSAAASIVDVDDRPTIGGGLPDFWQSNVSRVARACLANPNIGVIIAIGDTNNAHHTLIRLHHLAREEATDMQPSLPMGSEHLEKLAARGLQVITVDADADAVLGAIEESVSHLLPQDFTQRPIVDLVRKSRRRLPIGTPNREYRLGTTDGLRTRTFADVYPEALQLIRGADAGLDQLEPQRGKFREITGFKVVLTAPFQDKIADYWRPNEDLLTEYYERTFEDAEGIFGSRLKSPAFGSAVPMEEFAVEAVANALANKTPTRRINLPITPDGLDQPLGLSCIQLMPRARDDETPALDAIFVWRTVDALVGFPFSAYGSIKWMQDFLDRVNAKLGSYEGEQKARPGTLTYIALSFHMYLHEGDLEIARTIVQDASL